MERAVSEQRFRSFQYGVRQRKTGIVSFPTYIPKCFYLLLATQLLPFHDMALLPRSAAAG